MVDDFAIFAKKYMKDYILEHGLERIQDGDYDLNDIAERAHRYIDTQKQPLKKK